MKSSRLSAGDVPFQSDSPDCQTVFLCRDHDDGFLLDRAATLALFRASDVGFVDLNLAGKAIPIRPYHRSAQLVQPSPSRFVAAQPQHPLQAQGADTILLAGYEPHRKKPYAQRLSGVMEHRASSQRSLRIARFAHQHTARRHPRLPENPTTPANESVRPAQPPDVVTATRLDPKPVVHFMECARVINAGDRSCIFHGATVSMIFTWVKGIPI